MQTRALNACLSAAWLGLTVGLILLVGLSGCETLKPSIEVPPISQVSQKEIEDYILEGNPSRALQGLDILKRDGSAIPAVELEELQEDAALVLLGMFEAALDEDDFGKALIAYRSAISLSENSELLSTYGDWSESRLRAAHATRLLSSGDMVAAYMMIGRALDSGEIDAETIALFYQSALDSDYLPLIEQIEALGVIPGEGGGTREAGITPLQLLKGTVTILVNKGIRLDRGVGYPDSVIGSGFFVDSRGYVITNYHVIESEVDPEYEGFSRLYIRLHDSENEKIPARVVGWDSVLDIALLKAEVEPDYVFPFDADVAYEPGDEIYAIGSPGGLRNTVTSGIVSATGRRFLQIGSTLQVDVPINPGNSGGPLVNANGVLIGVVFAGIEQFEGINFAIPSSWIVDIIPRLFEGEAVVHSWLGLAVEETRKGLEVSYSVPGESAHRSGIRIGDIILSVNGVDVAAVEEVQALLIDMSPETLITVAWERDGQVKSGLLSVDKRPPRPLDTALERDIYINLVAPLFGMVVEETGSQFWEKGYRISHVYLGGIADETGLSVDDPLTIEDWVVDEENRMAYLKIVVKKKKAGFIERAIQLGVYLELANLI